MKNAFFQSIFGKLIVSCQALKGEPLYGSEMMAKMALAAQEGGAVAIRANGKNDIQAITNEVKLPVIGLIKREYSGSNVYITPTKREVNSLCETDVAMIALDATARKRPGGEQLSELIQYIKKRGKLVMADISTVKEGIVAATLGADCIGTTLSGYTPYSPQLKQPDFQLIERLSKSVSLPVLAEGRIWSPEHAVRALQLGAWSVVVGSAITRPQLIVNRFQETLLEAGVKKDG